jgi:hypothetical protein
MDKANLKTMGKQEVKMELKNMEMMNAGMK